jgi:hypothetical protein
METTRGLITAQHREIIDLLSQITATKDVVLQNLIIQKISDHLALLDADFYPYFDAKPECVDVSTYIQDGNSSLVSLMDGWGNKTGSQWAARAEEVRVAFAAHTNDEEIALFNHLESTFTDQEKEIIRDDITGVN